MARPSSDLTRPHQHDSTDNFRTVPLTYLHIITAPRLGTLLAVNGSKFHALSPLNRTNLPSEYYDILVNNSILQYLEKFEQYKVRLTFKRNST